jgi:hypothetical protein
VYDFVSNVQRYGGDIRRIFLDTDKWATFATQHDIRWEKRHFESTKVNSILAVRGIYVFTLEMSPSELPAHGYMLYMGQAGQGTNGNLRKRFGDYRSDMNRKKIKRPLVAYMLKRWRKHLYFNFCALPDPAVNLRVIETAFLDAISPPMNTTDFSAEFNNVRRAAF